MGVNDERNVNVEFGAKIQSLVSGSREAAAAVKESTEQMKAHVETLNKTVESVKVPFIALLAVLAGGEMFKESIEKVAELAVELDVMAQKTGAGVEQLSALRYAADLSHVSTEALSIGLQRLARGMESAAKGSGPAHDAFELLGLKATGADGRLIPLNDMLLKIAQRFAEMEDGAGKTALAMDIFGRSGASLIPLLNKGRDGIRELEEEAGRLGVTMTDKGVEVALAYEEQMKKVHAEMESMSRTIALTLMPTLTQLGEAFTETGSKGNLMRDIGEAIGDVLRGMAIVANDAALAVHLVRDALVSLKDPEAALASATEHLREWQATLDKLTKPKTGLEDDPALFALLGGTKKPPPAPKDKEGLLRAFEEQWLKIKESNAENFGDLAALELAFWRTKLSAVEQGSKEYVAIHRRIADLTVQVNKQGFESQLGALHAQEELEKDNLEVVVAIRQQELALIREHYAEASREVQEGIRRVNEATHAVQKETAKEWETAIASIPKAFDSAVRGIGTTVMSMRDLFRSFFRDLTVMGIEAGATSLRHHVATELAKKNVTIASAASRVAAESWAAITSVATSAWAALVQIANYAAVTIAATWASLSAIPFVGPFIAPAVALASGALVLSLGGRVASAAGGFDIPAGINPMTQLHQQEMVLPAELANRIRGMTGPGGGGDTYHVTVHAMDARSFTDFAARNHTAIAGAVKKSVKQGALRANDLAGAG